MQALASARIEQDWPATRFHPGDLDWWLVQDYGRMPGVAERVRLWFDADAASETAPGALRAFGWFSLPGEFDFLLASDDSAEVDALMAELVAWGDERRTALAVKEVAPLKAWASAREPAVRSLERLGLVADLEHAFVHLTGDLAIADAWAPPSLAEGLTIRPLATEADLESRVACGRAAFTGSTMTVERYRTTFDANLYRPELDLLVVDGEGRVVAFTLCWLDPVTRVAELEPVGVLPELHRRGLGREICRAALRRARELGATRAVIGAERENPAAVGLYQDLGLRIATEIVGFGRPTPTQPG
jgi:ribosomal protein S18 acetylase RimI-like enzyme